MKPITAVLLVMLLILTGMVTAQPYHYYKIDVAYSFGAVTINSVTIEPSQKELQTPIGQHIAEVVSFDNQMLNVTFFDIPLLVLYDTVDPETGEINGGGQFELNETNVTLYVPYYENAAEINIYDWNLTRLASIDVKEYAREITEQGKDLQPPPVSPVESDEEMKQWRGEAESQQRWKTIWIVLGILIALAIVFWLWRTRGE